MAKKSETKGNAYAEMQSAAQQAQNINSERLRNVALERQDQGNIAANMNVMAEAGGLIANDMGSSTAATLGKYGYKPGPQVKRTQSVNVKPNNIHITNNNITTNNIAGGGAAKGDNGSAAKFKTWVSNSFARQKEESARREKEYNKREWSLSKTANKMLRKMESASRDVAETLNPSNIGQTVGNQMKMLLMIFGVRFLAQNWTKVLKIANNIYNKIVSIAAFFGVGDATTVQRLKQKGDDLQGVLVKLLGGKPGHHDPKMNTISGRLNTLMTAFGDHIKKWMEYQMEMRGIAMKSIKFPDLHLTDNKRSGQGPIDRLVSGLGNVMSRTFSGVSEYLGNVMVAMINPKAGITRGIQSSMKNEGLKNSQDQSFRDMKDGRYSHYFQHAGQHLMGGYALVYRNKNGKTMDTLTHDAVDSNGNLNGTADASISQGRDLLGTIRDARETGHIDTARLVSGLERLQRDAESRGTTVVDRETLSLMFGASADKMIRSGKVKTVPMKLVSVDTTEADRDALHAYSVRRYNDKAGGWMQHVVGGGMTVAGGLIGGGVLGASLGAAAGNWMNNAGQDRIYNKLDSGTKLTWVPVSDPRPEATINGKKVGKWTFYGLTPEALQEFSTKLGVTNGKGFTTDNYNVLIPNAEKYIIGRAGGRKALDAAWNKKGKKMYDAQTQDYGDDLANYGRLAEVEKRAKLDLETDEWSQEKETLKRSLTEAYNNVAESANSTIKNTINSVNNYFTGPGDSSNTSGPTSQVTSAGFTNSQYSAKGAVYSYDLPPIPAKKDISFNVDAACKEIKRISTYDFGERHTKREDKSAGECALHVRMALGVGLGIADTRTVTRKLGGDGNAKSYSGYLGAFGFSPLDWKGYYPKRGDVVVMPAQGKHVYGHIAMFAGDYWYSDFRQRDMWGGNQYRSTKRGVMFRHVNQVNAGDSVAATDGFDAGGNYISFNNATSSNPFLSGADYINYGSTGGFSSGGNVNGGVNITSTSFASPTQVAGSTRFDFSPQAVDAKKLYSGYKYTTQGQTVQLSAQEQMNRAGYIMKRLMESGLTKEQAAGIVGSLKAESGLASEWGELKDGKHNSSGLAMWNGELLTGLKKFAAARGKHWQDFYTQVDYLIEKGLTFKRDRRTGTLYDIISKTKNAEEAATAWTYWYERPKDYENTNNKNYDLRRKYARATASLIDSGDAIATGAGVTPVSYTGSSIQIPEGKIVLVGDSYAVLMSSYFKNDVSSKGKVADFTIANSEETKNKTTNKTCVSQATIERVKKQAEFAMSLSPAVMVIHAGLNNSGESEAAIANKLISVGSVPKSKGVAVFLIAPISNQPAAFNTGKNSGNAAKVARAVRTACKSAGYGLIDLEPTSSYYSYDAKAAGHPKSNEFAKYAKDTVELLFRGGGIAGSTVEGNDVQAGLWGNTGLDATSAGGGESRDETYYSSAGEGLFPILDVPTNTDSNIKNMQRSQNMLRGWEKISSLGDYGGFKNFSDFEQWYGNKSEYKKNRVDTILSALSPSVLAHLKSMYPNQNLGDILSTMINTVGDSWLKMLRGWQTGSSYTNRLNSIKVNNKDSYERLVESAKSGGIWRSLEDLSLGTLGNGYIKDDNGKTLRVFSYKNNFDEINGDNHDLGRYQSIEYLLKEILKGNYHIVGKDNEGNYLNSKYNDDLGAYAVFGDDYLKLKERIKLLEEKEGRTSEEELDLSNSKDKLKSYKHISSTYISKASDMSNEERAIAFGSTKTYADYENQLFSLRDEEAELAKEEAQRMNELGTEYGWNSQKYIEGLELLKKDMKEKYDALDEKRNTILNGIKNFSDFMTEETQKCFDEELSNNIKASTVELLNKFEKLTDENAEGGAFSYLDAINEMTKEYGEGWMQKIANAVDGSEKVKDYVSKNIETIMGKYLTSEPTFNWILEGIKKNSSSLPGMEKVFERLRAAYNTVTGINSVRRMLGLKEMSYNKVASIFDKAATVWDNLQQVRGMGRPFGTDGKGQHVVVDVIDTNGGTHTSFDVDLSKPQYQDGTGGYLPLGFDGTKLSFDKNGKMSNSSAISALGNAANAVIEGDTSSRFIETTYKSDVVKENGYIILKGGLKSEGATKGNSTQTNPGTTGNNAEGGFTNPGGKWDKTDIYSGHQIHAGEWVAPQWMLRDPAYKPMIDVLEKSRVTRKAGMQPFSYLSDTESNNGEGIAKKLDTLIELADKGNQYSELNIRATSEGLSSVGTIIANKPVAQPSQPTVSVKSFTS